MSDPVGTNRCDVLITGTGSLARAAIMTLSTVSTGGLRVGIGGRSPGKATWLALAANSRAAALGLDNFFFSVELDWSSPEQMSAALSASRPKVILHTATYQSSWELNKPSAWSSLIARGGFILTSPLHAVLPARLMTAANAAGLQPSFINGSLPDFVNGLLQAAGFPITTGFGNICILATAISAFLSLPNPGDVRLVAQWEPHVADFREPPEKRRHTETMLWINGKRETAFHDRFRDLRLPPATDDELNLITGALAAPMILAFLQKRDYVGHAPGPYGRPGGYPIAIRDGKLTLDLPDQLSEPDAIAFNTRFEELDHVKFDRGRKIVELHGPAREALEEHLPQWAGRYSVASLRDIEAAASDLLALRDRLGGT